MVRLACLLLFALSLRALAEDELSPPEVCDDDFASCKEGCTLRFGTDFKVRDNLLRCMGKCKHTHDTCLERFMEVRHNELEAKQKEEYRAKTGQGTAKYPTDKPAPDPKPDPSEPELVPRDVTRGNELGPAVDKDPEAYPGAPQPNARAKPAPKPAQSSAQSAPTASKPPPPQEAPKEEPKRKKDLSEWDPNDVK